MQNSNFSQKNKPKTKEEMEKEDKFIKKLGHQIELGYSWLFAAFGAYSIASILTVSTLPDMFGWVKDKLFPSRKENMARYADLATSQYKLADSYLYGNNPKSELFSALQSSGAAKDFAGSSSIRKIAMDYERYYTAYCCLASADSFLDSALMLSRKSEQLFYLKFKSSVSLKNHEARLEFDHLLKGNQDLGGGISPEQKRIFDKIRSRVYGQRTYLPPRLDSIRQRTMRQ